MRERRTAAATGAAAAILAVVCLVLTMSIEGHAPIAEEHVHQSWRMARESPQHPVDEQKSQGFSIHYVAPPSKPRLPPLATMMNAAAPKAKVQAQEPVAEEEGQDCDDPGCGSKPAETVQVDEDEDCDGPECSGPQKDAALPSECADPECITRKAVVQHPAKAVPVKVHASLKKPKATAALAVQQRMQTNKAAKKVAKKVAKKAKKVSAAAAKANAQELYARMICMCAKPKSMPCEYNDDTSGHCQSALMLVQPSPQECDRQGKLRGLESCKMVESLPKGVKFLHFTLHEFETPEANSNARQHLAQRLEDTNTAAEELYGHKWALQHKKALVSATMQKGNKPDLWMVTSEKKAKTEKKTLTVLETAKERRHKTAAMKVAKYKESHEKEDIKNQQEIVEEQRKQDEWWDKLASDYGKQDTEAKEKKKVKEEADDKKWREKSKNWAEDWANTVQNRIADNLIKAPQQQKLERAKQEKDMEAAKALDRAEKKKEHARLVKMEKKMDHIHNLMTKALEDEKRKRAKKVKEANEKYEVIERDEEKAEVRREKAEAAEEALQAKHMKQVKMRLPRAPHDMRMDGWITHHMVVDKHLKENSASHEATEPRAPMAQPKRRSFTLGSYKKPVMTQKLKKKLQSVGRAIVVGANTSPGSMAKARSAERLAEAVVQHDEQMKAFAERKNSQAKQRGFRPNMQAQPLKALPQQLQVKARKLIRRTERPQQIVDPRAIAKAVAEEKAAERQVVKDEAAKKIALEAEREAVKELHKPLHAPVPSQPAVEIETPASKEDPGNLFSAPPSKEAIKSNVKPETLAEARQEEELAEERLKKDQEMRAYAAKADAQHSGFQQDHDACVRDCERMRRREEAAAREAAAEPTQHTVLVQTEPVGSECDCDGYVPKAASAASESHAGHAEEFEAWYSAA